MDFLLKSLREWKVAQPLEQRANNLVFANEVGEPAAGWGWRVNGIGAACKAAEVERITWQDLRHFYASVLIFSSELNDSTITEFLGHSSIAFSKKEYARWFKDRKRDEKIAAKLGAAFGRG
jgi:integrase